MVARITWTEDRIDRLRVLCAEKLSFREIATELGVSRSAVMGAAHRRGIIKTYQPAGSHSKNHPKVARRKKPAVQNRPRELEPPVSPMRAHFLGISFMGLMDRDCRYPEIIDGETFYCGQPKQEGSSYCPGCHAIVWIKPVNKSRLPFVSRGFAA